MGRGREQEETETAVRRDAEPGVRQSLLVVSSEGIAAYELPTKGTMSIGRSSDSDIVIDLPSVSRAHAALHTTPGGLFVEDLGSSNGTRLGGKKLAAGERAAVGRGVLIEIGMATIVVQAADATPSASPGRERAPGPDASTQPTADRILQLAELAAQSRITVLLRGETGVGKEVVAQAIHRMSPRADKPLLCLNCAAMPEALLESELFGFERGAFTGASQAKAGLIEAAHGGTVFLDEVAELPLVTQAKLLRVLDTRELQRIGALSPRAVDVRFLAATNRDLEALVAAGGFRSDLYYRLNGFSLAIPALRDRVDEIEGLARGFVADAAREAGRPAVAISERALSRLRRAPWPGNIRELRNVIERAFLLCGSGPIDVAHLPAELDAGAPSRPPPRDAAREGLRDELKSLERQRIVEALAQSDGNQTKAAQLLGLSRRTLIERLDAHGLPRPRKR